MNTQTVQMLYDYSYWAHRKVWGCVEQLTEAQFREDTGYSFGSVYSQVVHTMSAEWIWFSPLQGTSPTAVFRDEDYPTRADVRAKWDDIESNVRACGASLSEDDLHSDFSYTTTSGKEYQNNRLHILLHVVNHGTDHRAQTLAILDRIGGPTLEQDLIFYLREQ